MGCNRRYFYATAHGDMPQLLWSLKMTTTPIQTIIKKDVKEESGEECKAPRLVESPVMVKLEGHCYQWQCGNCDIAPMGSKRGMDAHI